MSAFFSVSIPMCVKRFNGGYFRPICGYFLSFLFKIFVLLKSCHAAIILKVAIDIKEILMRFLAELKQGFKQSYFFYLNFDTSLLHFPVIFWLLPEIVLFYVAKYFSDY